MALFRWSLATTVSLVGGVCIALGGLVEFFRTFVAGVHASTLGGVFPAALALTGTLTIGFFVLLTSRPRIIWWPGRRTFNGLLLVLLGILAWVFSGGFILTEVGALLAILGGVLLPFEGLFVGMFGGWRRWLRRGSW